MMIPKVTEMLTTDEAAEILDVRKETIARLLREQKLKGFKRGRDWFAYAESVQAYLNTIKGKGKNDPRRGLKEVQEGVNA